jgi:hypothetical protein
VHRILYEYFFCHKKKTSSVKEYLEVERKEVESKLKYAQIQRYDKDW